MFGISPFLHGEGTQKHAYMAQKYCFLPKRPGERGEKYSPNSGKNKRSIHPVSSVPHRAHSGRDSQLRKEVRRGEITVEEESLCGRSNPVCYAIAIWKDLSPKRGGKTTRAGFPPIPTGGGRPGEESGRLFDKPMPEGWKDKGPRKGGKADDEVPNHRGGGPKGIRRLQGTSTQEGRVVKSQKQGECQRRNPALKLRSAGRGRGKSLINREKKENIE